MKTILKIRNLSSVLKRFNGALFSRLYAREDTILILPLMFALPSLAANNIAIVNSHDDHNNNKDTSHAPDDDHPKRDVGFYRKERNEKV